MSTTNLASPARRVTPASRSAVTRLDDAVERVARLRENLLRQVEGPQRAERLALLFESEAQLWSQLYEVASLRVVWRAALAAEANARRHSRNWQERAAAACESEAAPATERA